MGHIIWFLKKKCYFITSLVQIHNLKDLKKRVNNMESTLFFQFLFG